MKTPITLLLFAVRHLLVVLAAMVFGCVVWTALYIILLVIAVITDSGVGGPLAYPGGILLILIACALIGWGIFAPACGVGLLISRAFGLPKLAGIPIAFIAAGVLTWLMAFAFSRVFPATPAPSFGKAVLFYLFFFPLPLGVQWWFTEGPGALYEFLKNWTRRRLAAAPEPGTY